MGVRQSLKDKQIQLDSLPLKDMSSIISTSLRRVCQSARVPVMRQVSTCSAMTRVMGESQVSRVQSQLLTPVVVSGQQQLRAYSGADPLNMKFINDRVMLVLNLFDKIDNNKLTHEAHFINDLGLDSLDHVEIMLMIEDEFGFEIPDDHGEKLVNASMIIKYVADHEDIYE